MIYEIDFPIWVYRMANRLTEDEKAVDIPLRELESMLRDGKDMSVDDFRAYRAQQIPNVYRAYIDCNESRFKPEFLERLNKAVGKIERRIQGH